MARLIVFVLLSVLHCSGAFAAAVKLGAGNASASSKPSVLRPKNTEISCTENSNCHFSEECVGLKCVKICRPNPCIGGKHCVPTGPEEPHTYKCVECVYHEDCAEGYECVKGFVCAKKDPCREAICSPGAPFCVPEPFKSLPYTCVQCTDNSHCPPVGGLSRSCVNHFCLFNVAGNIPQPTAPNNYYDEEQQAGYDDYVNDGYADDY